MMRQQVLIPTQRLRKNFPLYYQAFAEGSGILTLTISDKHSDLGTPEIHKQKSVLVEGGPAPRAKVMDQSLIDRYLMDGLLSLQEHQAAEYVLNQAVQAGVFTKPLRYEASSGCSVSDPMANESLERFGRTLRLVKKTLGAYHKAILQEVVLNDWDISVNPDRLRVFKEALQVISERRMSGGKNPMRHLK